MRIKSNQKAMLAFAIVMLASIAESLAQSGATGITAGTNELLKYITPVTNLTMAIGGIVGIVGGIRIYSKWNNGDQDVTKELMGWMGSAVFLIVAPLIIKGFFGV